MVYNPFGGVVEYARLGGIPRHDLEGWPSGLRRLS
jgi:hypothetical protein